MCAARRVIVAIMAGTVAVNFWGIAYVAMVPVVGEQVLGLSAFPNGVLMSMLGLGALAGAVLMSRASRSRTFTRIFLLSIVVVVLGVLGFGFFDLAASVAYDESDLRRQHRHVLGDAKLDHDPGGTTGGPFTGDGPVDSQHWRPANSAACCIWVGWPTGWALRSRCRSRRSRAWLRWR